MAQDVCEIRSGHHPKKLNGSIWQNCGRSPNLLHFTLRYVTSYFSVQVFVHWPLSMETADLMRWEDGKGKNSLMLFFVNPLVQNHAAIYKTPSSHLKETNIKDGENSIG